MEVGLGNRAPPDRTTVTVTVWPDDQRRAEASVETERQDAGNRAVFVARPIFDGEGTWLVRVRLVGPAASDDVTFPLEVTPPYPPWIAYIWCLVPLIALCALWATGVRRQAQVPAPAARGSAQP